MAETKATTSEVSFSGNVQSQTNAGTAGGTMYYINLGGIKMLWCIGANQTSSAAGNNYTFTLPTSFFSSIQSVSVNAINMTVLAQQYSAVTAASTSSVTANVTSPGGNATSGINLVVIGT